MSIDTGVRMMTDFREFHISDVLTAATGTMLSQRGIKGVYDILNYMTGDDIYTYQIPRAINECAPYLLNSYPWIRDIDTTGVNGDNITPWLIKQAKEHGAYHAVYPIHFDDHEVIDPVDELGDMVGAKKLLVVAWGDNSG